MWKVSNPAPAWASCTWGLTCWLVWDPRTCSTAMGAGTGPRKTGGGLDVAPAVLAGDGDQDGEILGDARHQVGPRSVTGTLELVHGQPVGRLGVDDESGRLGERPVGGTGRGATIEIQNRMLAVPD